MKTTNTAVTIRQIKMMMMMMMILTSKAYRRTTRELYAAILDHGLVHLHY